MPTQDLSGVSARSVSPHLINGYYSVTIIAFGNVSQLVTDMHNFLLYAEFTKCDIFFLFVDPIHSF